MKNKNPRGKLLGRVLTTWRVLSSLGEPLWLSTLVLTYKELFCAQVPIRLRYGEQ